MVWFLEGICFLPTFLVIWSSATFIINFSIAAWRRDVDPFFPYISDTGAYPPESCLFSLMATISAFAGFATMFARYKFVHRLIEDTHVVSPRLNAATFVLASISCIGMAIVAAFQETELRIVHDFGAFIFFVFGVIYIIIQTIISFKFYPNRTSKCVCGVRMFFATLALLAVFPTIVCGYLVQTTKMHWDTEDKDYDLHVASSVCEWVTAFSFVFYFFTFIQEFKQFTVTMKVNFQEFT